MTNHELINQDSGDVGYYTPIEIVAAARETMGIIELDPFSSAEANKRVGAIRYFTPKEDGFKQPWITPAFWMNHPFGRATNEPCIAKAVAEFSSGNAIQGCCITFAATSERWFQPLLRFPQCFLSPRTNYFLPDGTKKVGVTKGSVVTYFGNDPDAFHRAFRHLGVVKVAY